jgi:hypothetical protein
MSVLQPPPRFGKVVVNGSLNLGGRHELIQEARPPTESESINVRHHLGGSSTSMDPWVPDEQDSLGEAMDYRLSDKTTGDLVISGAGLVTSFGIFGAPGSGKTVLLMRLLKQILEHEANDPARRYGMLILDPKAALIDDVRALVARAGRTEDLVVVDTRSLTLSKADGGTGPINVIDCTLDPQELGSMLVLAGQSAGIAASDAFWFSEWANLFAASMGILKADAYLRYRLSVPQPVTLNQLITAILDEDGDAPAVNGKRQRVIQGIAQRVVARQARLPPELRADVPGDVRALDRFFGQHYVGTIEAFVTKAFGMFRRARLACYSAERRQPGRKPFYEDIIEHGRIVLVSVSPSEPVLAKTLCTLIKCLFQRTVLARGELLASGTLTNAVRPLLIACDEYSEIASEVPGQSMGDGQFLALARQYGCMALLATQSVNVLEASSLRDTWRSVFSNFAAKIYMRLADSETAEAASKLAGESDWRMVSSSSSYQAGGKSAGRSQDLRERRNLPTAILTQVLRTGEAVVIGSLDGGATLPGMFFMRVPKPETSDA